MASADTMAFATPLKRHSSTIFILSSSPGLPSPSELSKMAPTLRTGSRAAPIPTTANATFTSASSLLKSTPKKEESAGSIRKFKAPPNFDEILAEASAKPKARKSRAKKVTEDEEAQVKKPARARTKKAAPTVDDDTTAKEKAVRKPRAKKVEDGAQSKIPKARITKSSSGKGSAAERSKKILGRDLDIEKENLPSRFLENHAEARPLSEKPLALPFSGLLNSFGYTDGEKSQEQETPKQASLKAPVARKRKSPEISKADSVAPKPKIARKKAKTITDQATAAYVVDDPDEAVVIPKQAGAITKFFQYQPKDNEVGQTTSDGFEASKVGPILDIKLPSKSSKLKPGDQGLPILLSPESAMKQYKQQDILFGTSSQLADPENSPTFIRDVQKAIRNSNEMDDPFFIDSPSDSSFSASTSQRIRSRAGRSNLWAASSRDEYGELLDVEVIDMSTTPVSKVKSPPAHLPTDENAAEMTAGTSNKPPDHENITTSTLETPVSEDIVKGSAIRKTVDPLGMAMKDTPTVDSVKAPKSKLSTRKPKAKKAVHIERPDYTTYTTAELTKAVASFGFKVVKKRETMITLLNKCWDSMHGAKASNQEPPCEEVEISKPSEPVGKFLSTTMNPAQTSPKKPRGRPKKAVEAVPALPVPQVPLPKTKGTDSDSEDIPLSLRKTPKKPNRKSKVTIDEISDSEPALTPSPPRRKAPKKKTPVLPLKPSDDTNTIEAPSSQAELFSHITKAIKSIPPSTSSTEPNWHEKMLLYDPIILEDLAVWLNTGGLQSVGWDGEVNPSEVKNWCESKSVCCLWRENLRGGARSRY